MLTVVLAASSALAVSNSSHRAVELHVLVHQQRPRNVACPLVNRIVESQIGHLQAPATLPVVQARNCRNVL